MDSVYYNIMYNAVHVCKTHDYIYVWSFKRGDRREIIPLYIHITVTITRTTRVEIPVLIRIFLRRHRNSNLYGRFYAYSTKDVTVPRSSTRDRFFAFLYPSYAIYTVQNLSELALNAIVVLIVFYRPLKQNTKYCNYNVTWLARTRTRNFRGAKSAAGFSSRHFTVAFVIPLHRLARCYGIVDGFTVAVNNSR